MNIQMVVLSRVKAKFGGVTQYPGRPGWFLYEPVVVIFWGMQSNSSPPEPVKIEETFWSENKIAL
jgi:hypothetical protein